MALAGEAGELCAELQWLSDADIADGLHAGPLREQVASEAADVLLYLLRFADVSGIDLIDEAQRKVLLSTNSVTR